ncbi:MAG: type I restriction enzyme HsdR N-terminal domain-containing protein [Muribaculaceae bacterium]|nr:type I restriction enzyme HsdR N-terminal domain-containing protein [Muribaculaceae bacterium]
MQLKTRLDNEIVKIFDPLRDKYVALTPEEYVRQHFVNYLMTELKYPASVMANEIGIDLNGTRKRCDTVVFGADMKPLVIIEYKAPGVEISQTVFDQIARYNMQLQARYLIVSNGIRHYCCRLDYDRDTYNFLPRIPEYSSISHPFSPN